MAAGLSRSTFYYQAKALQAGDKYAQLKASIRAVYERHKGRYGYRRITAELVRCGQQVNHKTVQRLMNDMALKSLVRLKKVPLLLRRAERNAQHAQPPVQGQTAQ